MSQSQYRQSPFYGDREAWDALLEDHGSAIELSHYLASRFLEESEATGMAARIDNSDKSTRLVATLRNDGTLENVRRTWQELNAALPASQTPLALADIWRTLMSVALSEKANQVESEANNAAS